MAFAEVGKGTEYISTCHGCGNKCKGGYRKCKNFTEEHRSKVGALETQGRFRRGSSSSNNNINSNKKSTVNVAAGSGQRDDNNNSGDDATKATNSNSSKSNSPMT